MPIRRGEIYFVNLDPVQGHEQGGRRPVLVVSDDSINQLPLVISVVIGTKGATLPKDYSSNVRFSSAECGLPMETVFLCFKSARWIAQGFQISPLDYCQEVPCFGSRRRYESVWEFRWKFLDNTVAAWVRAMKARVIAPSIWWLAW
jgi:mRNA interferase MazF